MRWSSLSPGFVLSINLDVSNKSPRKIKLFSKVLVLVKNTKNTLPNITNIKETTYSRPTLDTPIVTAKEIKKLISERVLLDRQDSNVLPKQKTSCQRRRVLLFIEKGKIIFVYDYQGQKVSGVLKEIAKTGSPHFFEAVLKTFSDYSK